MREARVLGLIVPIANLEPDETIGLAHPSALFLSTLNTLHALTATVSAIFKSRAALHLCEFRNKWSTDSGVKRSGVPVDLVQSSGGKWSSFGDRTGILDHIPESWTTWNGTVDRITGMGQ